MTTAYYGRCDKCGKGLVAEVTALSKRTMLGPSISLVCQEHIPVGNAEAVRVDCLSAQDRVKVEEWMRWQGMPLAPSSDSKGGGANG